MKHLFVLLLFIFSGKSYSQEYFDLGISSDETEIIKENLEYMLNSMQNNNVYPSGYNSAAEDIIDTLSNIIERYEDHCQNGGANNLYIDAVLDGGDYLAAVLTLNKNAKKVLNEYNEARMEFYFLKRSEEFDLKSLSNAYNDAVVQINKAITQYNILKNNIKTVYEIQVDKMLEQSEYDDERPQNGKGFQNYPNGDIEYRGEYKNGLMNGFGVYHYSNGDVYAGNFLDNRRNGQGTYFYKESGQKFVGEWKNEKRYNGIHYNKRGYEIATYLNGVKQ